MLVKGGTRKGSTVDQVCSRLRDGRIIVGIRILKLQRSGPLETIEEEAIGARKRMRRAPEQAERVFGVSGLLWPEMGCSSRVCAANEPVGLPYLCSPAVGATLDSALILKAARACQFKLQRETTQSSEERREYW